MSILRLLVTGEPGKAYVLNRPHQDALVLSGYLVDGSDFAGYAKAVHTHTAASITDLATATTNITKLGTITTGIWQGTAIDDTYLAALSASKLTGAALPASIVTSSLTTVGVLASPHMTSPVINSGGLSMTGTLAITGAISGPSAITLAPSANITNASGYIVLGAGASLYLRAAIGSSVNINDTTTATTSIGAGGGLTTIANGLTVTAGGLTVSAGGASITGAVTLNGSTTQDITTTATSGNLNLASYVRLVVAPAGATAAGYAATESLAYQTTNIANTGDLSGGRLQAVVGAGTSNAVTGADCYAQYSSATASPGGSLYAGRFRAIVDGGANCSHIIGWKVNSPQITGVGSAADQAFGGYVADQNVTGATDASALHIEGSGVKNGITWSGGAGSAINMRLYATSTAALRFDVPNIMLNGALTVASGLTVTAGGLTVSAGNLAVSAGDVRLTSGFVIQNTNGTLYLRSGGAANPITIGDQAASPITLGAGGGSTTIANGLTVSAGQTAVQALSATSITLSASSTISGFNNGFIVIQAMGSSGNLYLRAAATTTINIADNSNASTTIGAGGGLTTIANGLTVTAGTTAVQALTATGTVAVAGNAVSSSLSLGATIASSGGSGYAIKATTYTFDAATTSAFGIANAPTVATGAAVNGLFGLRLFNAVLSGTATLTTQYGIYIDAQTSGANNYAISTNAGWLRFGDVIGLGVTPRNDVAIYGINSPAGFAASANINAYGYYSYFTFPAVATANIYGGVFGVQTSASAYTVTSAYGLQIADATLGAGSAITTQYGLYIANQTKGVGNYAIYTNTGTVKFSDRTLIGSTASSLADRQLYVAATALTGASQFGAVFSMTGNTDATSLIASVYSSAITPANAATYAAAYAFYAAGGSNGAGSTLTTRYGLYVADQTTGVTNYAIYTSAGRVYLTGATNVASTFSVFSTANYPAIAFVVEGTNVSTGTQQYGAQIVHTINASSTTTGIGMDLGLGTAASAFTVGQTTMLNVRDLTLGAGSAVTTQNGIYIQSQTKGTTNYAIYTNAGLVRFGDRLSVVRTETAATTPAAQFIHTWNGAGLSMVGLAVYVTDTASAAGSLLVDMQVGGSSKFSVRKDGAVTFAGSVTATGAQVLTGAAGTYRIFNLSTAGVARWQFVASNAAEAGSNAGSDFTLNATDDTGAYIDSPIAIVRAASGAITLNRPVTANFTSVYTMATSGTAALNIAVSGDANARVQLLASGTIAWGPGNGASDVNLSRSAAGILASSGSLSVAKALLGSVTTLTYAPTMNIDASTSNLFVVTATNSTAFTFTVSNETVGEEITVQIINTSGGALGTVTWPANFKLAAWTQPATGFNRSISFYRNTNGSWYEFSRTPADVAN